MLISDYNMIEKGKLKTVLMHDKPVCFFIPNDKSKKILMLHAKELVDRLD